MSKKPTILGYVIPDAEYHKLAREWRKSAPIRNATDLERAKRIIAQGCGTGQAIPFVPLSALSLFQQMRVDYEAVRGPVVFDIACGAKGCRLTKPRRRGSNARDPR